MGKDSEKPDDCIRKKVVIADENWYLIVGKTFVLPTCPRENDPAMTTTRSLIDFICEQISKILENKEGITETQIIEIVCELIVKVIEKVE